MVSSRWETLGMCGDVLDPGSVDCVSCHAKTTRLSAIRATVTTGKRSVGMLSLIGIRAREAYGSRFALPPPATGSNARPPSAADRRRSLDAARASFTLSRAPRKEFRGKHPKKGE
jgi:hypothetical protein